MIVDRRKDTYDELMVAARDARLARSRRAKWTTGLIASIAGASGIYVAASNQHINALGDARNQAEAEAARLQARVAALEVQLDILRANQQWFRESAPIFNLGDKFGDLIDGLKGLDVVVVPTETGDRVETRVQYDDIVWLVEGTRQVPMTNGDFLWIPETAKWLEMVDQDSGIVNVYTTRAREELYKDKALPLQLTVPETGATSKVCVRLLEGQSRREPFRGTHRDVEIVFQSDDCEAYFDNERGRRMEYEIL